MRFYKICYIATMVLLLAAGAIWAEGSVYGYEPTPMFIARICAYSAGAMLALGVRFEARDVTTPLEFLSPEEAWDVHRAAWEWEWLQHSLFKTLRLMAGCGFLVFLTALCATLLEVEVPLWIAQSAAFAAAVSLIGMRRVLGRKLLPF